MKENSRLLLEKAQRAVLAAKTLLEAGSFPDFATGSGVLRHVLYRRSIIGR